MAILQTLPETSDHRCHRCQNWRSGHESCTGNPSARARLETNYVYNQSIPRENSRGIDHDARRELNARWGAVEDWWWDHQLGVVRVDDVAAVVDIFWDVPLAEILATLDRTLSRSKQRPRSLRYFKVALEEARTEFFKRSDSTAKRGGGRRSIAELLDARSTRYGGQGAVE